jgi:hypothetical protein
MKIALVAFALLIAAIAGTAPSEALAGPGDVIISTPYFLA